jgi:hypothetical protein
MLSHYPLTDGTAHDAFGTLERPDAKRAGLTGMRCEVLGTIAAFLCEPRVTSP